MGFFSINQLISFVFKSICFLLLAMCSFQFNLQWKCSIWRYVPCQMLYSWAWQKKRPVAFFVLCTYLAFPMQGVVKNCWYVVCHYFCHHCQILGLQKVHYFPHHLPTWNSYNHGPGAFHTYRTDDLKYSQRKVFTPFCILYLPEYIFVWWELLLFYHVKNTLALHSGKNGLCVFDLNPRSVKCKKLPDASCQKSYEKHLIWEQLILIQYFI